MKWYLGLEENGSSGSCVHKSKKVEHPVKSGVRNSKSDFRKDNRMSTSLLYRAFGVRDVVYQKTEYKEGITIIHATPSTKAIRGGTCFSERVTLKGRIERIFRTLPIGNKPVKIVCSIPRVQCKDSGNIRQISIPFAEPRRTYYAKFRTVSTRIMPLYDPPRCSPSFASELGCR
jgi:hypothetical protein